MIDREPDSTDAAFVARVREALERQTLPPGVAERLVTARGAALGSLRPAPPAPPTPSNWLPLGALASTVLAIGIAVVTTDTVRLPVVEDERALVVAQDVELLEDLEFLAWLDDEEHAS